MKKSAIAGVMPPRHDLAEQACQSLIFLFGAGLEEFRSDEEMLQILNLIYQEADRAAMPRSAAAPASGKAKKDEVSRGEISLSLYRSARSTRANGSLCRAIPLTLATLMETIVREWRRTSDLEHERDLARAILEVESFLEVQPEERAALQGAVRNGFGGNTIPLDRICRLIRCAEDVGLKGKRQSLINALHAAVRDMSVETAVKVFGSHTT
ncbi:MAG TPA: hypothetical protein VHD55_02665 [Candidatus Paceibacterota bacterium]|nr:hypothetical protein [Candidatus Paceibacterota bacterium]